MRNKIQLTFTIIVAVFMMLSCGTKAYVPKPKGYLNIEIPEHEYVKFDTSCNFAFEYSKYAVMLPYQSEAGVSPCWYNMLYPRYNATVHITYNPLKNDLKKYLDDSHDLVYKHVVKSSGIEEAMVSDTQKRVFGMIYKIDGDPACPYQFYLTDSTNHFFRAALYFNFKPNYDSLEQVVHFIEADMDHMANTFEWRN